MFVLTEFKVTVYCCFGIEDEVSSPLCRHTSQAPLKCSKMAVVFLCICSELGWRDVMSRTEETGIRIVLKTNTASSSL